MLLLPSACRSLSSQSGSGSSHVLLGPLGCWRQYFRSPLAVLASQVSSNWMGFVLPCLPRRKPFVALPCLPESSVSIELDQNPIRGPTYCLRQNRMRFSEAQQHFLTVSCQQIRPCRPSPHTPTLPISVACLDRGSASLPPYQFQ